MRLIYPPIAHSDESFLLALCKSVRAAETMFVPRSNEQKKSFPSFRFQAQHQHYINKYPHGSLQTVEFEGKKTVRIFVCKLTYKVRVTISRLLHQHKITNRYFAERGEARPYLPENFQPFPQFI